MVRKIEKDFTSGPLLKKMILYTLPIIGVNVLQLLFTAADLSVLGIFTGNDNAIAAVGAATPIINLCIAFFTAFSISANVLVARYIGQRDVERARRCVGTAITLSVIFGVSLMILGVLLADSLLIWTNCAKGVLPYASTYLKIYMLGMPIIMLYNFCASIFRAVGDTFRPLIFLIIGGVLNVCLNIFFIAVIKWDIEGVAIATVVSNCVSGISALVLMLKSDGYIKIEKKNLRIDKKEFLGLVQIGLPISISKCLFSFSNVLVSSELNTLGETAMAAHSITKEFDGFILEAVHGIGAANIAVISQNYGAKKLNRIKKVVLLSTMMQLVVSLSLGLVLIFAGRLLCGIMTSTKEVLDLCVVRINTVSIFYTILGVLNVFQETIRGIGYSLTSTLLSVLANIVLRVIYLIGVYPYVCIEGNVAHNLKMLYVLYPASWAIACVVAAIVAMMLFNRVKKRFKKEKEQEILEKSIEEKIA
ncbi:MAG: MATE family efflux transporter [Clostridiales bacterium]|nr:MATE family efflux transporter [Clostridiales bacterium]